MEEDSILHEVDIKFFPLPGKVVQDPKVISLCRAPYYKHPLGCPNWGCKKGCPPRVKLFSTVYKPDVQITIAQMDFGKYLRLKSERHPYWTERALRNSRHWQGHLRSVHNSFLANFKVPSGYQAVLNSEAMGINIFETCSDSGFVLERDPKSFVCHVNLLARIK